MDDTAIDVKLGHHDDLIQELKRHDEKQWVELGKIRQALTRLVPVWVTVVVSTMSFLTGSALTIAVITVKFAGKAG